MRVRVRAAGTGDVGVIAAKEQRIYFNCGCVLRVGADYELAFSLTDNSITFLSPEMRDIRRLSVD